MPTQQDKELALPQPGTALYEAAWSFATSLLENTSDMVAVVDSRLRFAAANGPFQREFQLVFGKSVQPDERLDDLLADWTGDRNRAAALCRRALAGESFRVTEEFGDAELLRKSYELAFNPVLDPSGQPVFAVIVVRDVSLLRSSEQRFGPLLEAAPDALVIMRADGTIDAANELAEKMFGYARHGLRGLLVEELVPHRLRERHRVQRAGFVRQPATRPMGAGNSRLLGMRSDGSEFPVDISLSPLQLGDGQMVVAAVRDMSARQAAEDALRELSARLEERVAERTAELEASNRAFRATFEQAAVGIAHVSLNGRWMRVNQQLCDMVGYTREEISDLTFQDITHPDDLDADLRQMYRLLAGEIASYDIDKRYVRKDGHIVWISLYASLVRDDAGAPQYFISVVQDADARKSAEAGLQRHKEQLELAIAATGLGLFDFDPRSGAAEWSPELKRHFGVAQDAAVTLGDFFERLHPADRGRARSIIHHALAGEDGGRFQFEYRPSPSLDGNERWFQARGQVLFEAGRPVRCVGTALEITAQRQAIEAVRERERQLQTIIDANPIGTVVGTSRGQITDANAAFLRMIGRTRDDLLAGQIHWGALTPHEHRADDERAVAQATRHGVSDLYEREFICAEGKRVPALLATASLGVDDQLVAFVLDISERKRAEEQIRQAALHDPLTGLPNRGLLFDYASHVFARARRIGRHCAMLFIDLDRFKPINDNHGHDVGDEVLKEVSARIGRCTRADDIVFRLGGDEFLVLLPDIDDDSHAGDVARHVAHCLEQPYLVRGLELGLSASIGISIFPRDGEAVDTLINNADAAMYLAKQAGRNNVQFYSKDLAAQAQMQFRIEERLKAALAHDAFELVYQPVVDMQSLRLMGVEALVRWAHSDIGPEQFVPVAEATGQIGRLSEWVLREVCRQHAAWCKQGLPAIPIAINVSAMQIRRSDFADEVARQLGECGIEPAALQIEVTETAMMENVDRAVEVLARLRGLGIKIALDDFGTGYSSLNYLSRLPIHKVKVDKSFVQRAAFDAPSRAITEAVIALGRTLALEVVAEGIETEETLNYLREQGCTQAQGFHVCRPVSATDFRNWFDRHRSAYGH